MLRNIPARLLEAAPAAYVWTENMGKIISTALLSMVPTFEGRYAVVTAIAMGMPVMFAYWLAVISSSVPVPLILWLMRPILDWFYTLPIKPVRAFAAWLENRTKRKRSKMNSDKKTGVMGWLSRYVSADTLEMIALYMFVAVPLPGTGGWTGSLLAALFNLPRLKSLGVIVLGNATACLITTLATTGVLSFIG